MREIATALLVLITVSGAAGYYIVATMDADTRRASIQRQIDPALLEPYRRYAIMEPRP